MNGLSLAAAAPLNFAAVAAVRPSAVLEAAAGVCVEPFG